MTRIDTAAPDLDRLLAPRTIAMVGASNNLYSIGGLLFANLKRSFGGALYPIHPQDDSVQGTRAYASLLDVPLSVDLVVIAVANQAVEGIMEQAVVKGVGGVVLLSSGFAEAGAEGLALQQRVAEIARAGGVRVMGPNCIGYLNIAGGVMANFALSPDEPVPPGGSVALISQSGGFGSYLTTKGLLTGLRLGWFVSTGNELDVNIAGVLRYLVERPEVRVLLAFSETLRDPEVFIAAARRAQALDKPLVVLKAGRSEVAAKAAMSHTASVVGAVDVFDAVCRQFGVIVAHSLEEMLDLGMIFQDGRRVTGNRLAIITASGGTGVLLADEASLNGLDVPTFPPAQQAQMLNVLHSPFFGSVSNPIDTTAAVKPAAIAALQNLVAQSPSVDMLSLVTWARATASNTELAALYQRTDKPMAVLSTNLVDSLTQAGVPTYTDPQRLARSLAALHRFSTRASLAADHAWEPNAERAQRARTHLQLPPGEQVLMEAQGKRLFAEYGIPLTREEWVHSEEEAIAAAARIGGNVVLKVMSYQLPHKSDAGAIRLGLQGADAVRDAYRDMFEEVRRRAPHAVLDGVLVQQMVPARLELTCGLQRDPVFGPMVAVGLGGVLVEQLAQTTLLRPPFGLDTARAALGQLLQGRLVQGRRGLSAEEQTQIAAIMVGVGNLALELDEVSEVDINPIRVDDGKAIAADALIVLADAVKE
ncbi:Acyl-CoA synthetase (NDP forming) [Pseudomonas sp. ok272]|uniref:acetate--CoA ligase family protein n=1 Tax=unclassified Pseudomonas TaxID=196821 RepID=UPI0008AD571D|nr:MULTISPECIES: acetate--CoA ligase family protein [unclassified Pseudomonas]SEN42935.1 Acyl-CoA synthetase (NDP forming) [Pseudomonas sp. ok272]SFN25419.1 Acyl-CoA synthetase (NDP forming) [Pseudomonas sp. ok602]